MTDKKYKVGNEFLQYHASASHVRPDFRDGWNACFAEAAIRISKLQDDLRFVERWAVHHGTKSYFTLEQTLSVIQHYPAITRITKSYADGKAPETFNPYARIAELEALTPITADELEKLKLDIANALASIAEYDQENTVLKAQLEAAKKDAERYLKLRRMAVELSLSHQVISQFVTNQGELDAAIQEGESMTPKSQTTADQVRELGLSVGDVIVGRENRGHEWSDTELTLLFIGKEVAVFSERNRSSVEGVISKWSKPKESASWNLQFRDWVKV